MNNPLAIGVLVAALGGCASPAATPYAPQDFDFGGLATGMVENVREVRRDIHAFQEAIEHSVQPQTAEQLVIRLDDGRAITVLEHGMRRFAPGQRVRIVSGSVAHE